MERARTAVVAALFALLAVTTVNLVAAAPMLQISGAAAVTWPVSTLVISEIQTGGASASDEFAEIANVGSTNADLTGIELVYITSTGGTVTRKASWPSSTILAPGRHLIVANTSGVYVSIADLGYSGGFAATGGTVVLRLIGGAPIDAVGWGDASNAFVEGSPAPAPPAGQSIERRPGGALGNTTDSNDNAADWFVQTVPSPQNLAAPPVPAPAPSPSPTPLPTSIPTPFPTPVPTADLTAPPSPDPTATSSIAPSDAPTPSPSPSAVASSAPSATPTVAPTATPSPQPTPSATPTPSPSAVASSAPSATPTVAPTATPSPQPTPSATPSPSPSPSPQPTSTPAPTPSPAVTGTPDPSPSPTPSPAPLPIVDARALPKGAAALIEGTLTTDLPALESGHVGFVQDGTAGIALYLDTMASVPIPAGTVVRLSGTIDERYGARTIRAAASAITILSEHGVPEAAIATTGAIDEPLEGLRVTVTGLTIGSPTSYSDGLGYLLDDGTGQVRVIVSSVALGGSTVVSGTMVVATGPVGQRDSTGTGIGGYRIHATLAGEFVSVPTPTPTPTPTASPSPSPSPSPTLDPTFEPTPGPTVSPSPGATVGPSPSPAPTPAPSAAAMSIAEVRARPVGSMVTVLGVVIAEAGRLGAPPVIVIADASGGIAVRLPDDVKSPVRGRLVLITGRTATPYGQLEVRPSGRNVLDVGTGVAPDALPIDGAALGEGTEGRLVVLLGTQSGTARRSATGDISVDVVDGAGTRVRIMVDASSRISMSDLLAGVSYRLTGVVGQRATSRGALDGYRIWLRDRSDIAISEGASGISASGISASGVGASGIGASGIGGAGEGTSGSQDPVISIGMARSLENGRAVVIGIVIAGPGLLDAKGRRVVIEDATGGIEVLLPAASTGVSIGTRLQVDGVVRRAWGAPRISAATVTILDAHVEAVAILIRGVPDEAYEWQLVRIAGTVTKVTRLGDRWKADLRVGSASVLIAGLAASGIPSTLLVDGRIATISGFVHRPYPTATDRRWAVTPRGSFDIALGPQVSTGARGVKTQTDSGVPTAYEGPAADGVAPPDVDLATLSEYIGSVVRIGGLLGEVTPPGFSLDDGTATAIVRVIGEATPFLALLHRGDAIGLVGRVEADPAGPRIVVDNPAGLVRLGALGEVVPIAAIAPVAPADSVAGTIAGRGLNADEGFGSSDNGLLLGALMLLIAAPLLMSMHRRQRARGRLLARVLGRLAGLRSGLGPAEING